MQLPCVTWRKQDHPAKAEIPILQALRRGAACPAGLETAMKHRINMAAGSEPADILITNARVVDVFSGLVRQDSVAIGDGVFLGFGQREAREVVDAQGAYLLPGFIDAHIHLESSMVTPARFA